MDRRYFAALLFSLLIILGYPYYLHWIGVSEKREKPDVQTFFSEKLEKTERVLPKRELKTSTQYPYRNGFFEATFTDKGGGVTLLKQGDTTFYRGDKEGTAIFAIRLFGESPDLFQESFVVREPEKEGAPPYFEYERAGEYRIRKKFFLGTKEPTLVVELELENLSNRERAFPLEFRYGLELDPSNRADEPKVRALRFSQGNLYPYDLRSLRKNPLTTTESLDWHGMTKKYYAVLVKPDARMVGQTAWADRERMLSDLRLAPVRLRPGERRTTRILIYAGPQRYELLREFGVGFENILSQGKLGMLRLALLMGLKFFHQLTGNYGVAILLITLLLKLLFAPFTHLSYDSMRKMQALQPKIKAFQKQYQKDATRLNKELMGLYKRNRVNPMMGCLPMVLQIPIFITFYKVLSETVELKGAGFWLWMNDLSAPDRLFTLPTTLPFIGDSINVLPVLMIGSMVWQQQLTPQTAATAGQEKLLYLTPIVFGLVFYNLPSGLVLYWLANNLLTIFHQLFIKRIPVILHHEDR